MATPAVRCHYEVLGIAPDADATAIKKAYRKLALQYHPDKNIASNQVNDETSTTKESLEQMFLQVQQAYECLSDAAERKWYDDHRDAILKGWSVSTGGGAGTGSGKDASAGSGGGILFNVVPYMYAGCYSGFNDRDANSFFNIYQSVFQQVFQGERDGATNINDVEYLSVPFGNSTSNYDTVVAVFYQAWESFSSVLSFAWADQWNVQEAEQRRIRRAMEEDNLRSRRKARKIRNDEIVTLIRFVKRRDPRVIAKKEEQEHLKLVREKELKELNKQRKLDKEKAMEEWREQVEREALAAEEDDRLNGRVRLADLEDDYDYGGGKKRGKGKKKKNKSIFNDSETETAANTPEEVTNTQEESANMESAPPADAGQQPSDLEELDSRFHVVELEKKPDWKCECCNEIFEEKKQMLNHFKSKQHKDMATSRKLEKNSSTDINISPDDANGERKAKKKNKANQNHVTDEHEKKISNSDPPEAHDSATEEDDDDENENQVYLEDEPLFWRCECCQKDFQSEGQMENHMNSKKHKAAYRQYERVVGKKLLYEVVEEIQKVG